MSFADAVLFLLVFGTALAMVAATVIALMYIHVQMKEDARRSTGASHGRPETFDEAVNRVPDLHFNPKFW